VYAAKYSGIQGRSGALSLGQVSISLYTELNHAASLTKGGVAGRVLIFFFHPLVFCPSNSMT